MVYQIDCSGITSSKELHRLLADTLSFPEWYGHNLDALYDCLTELAEPLRLHLNGWDSAAPWAPGFEAVLTAAQFENPELTVVFA